MQCFVYGAFLVEGETSIDFCRHLSGHNLKNLFAKFNQEAIKSCIYFLIQVFSIVFAILDSSVDELGIFGLLRGSKNQRWVCGSILWFVFSDSCRKSVLDSSLEIRSPVDWRWFHDAAKGILTSKITYSN